jgi:hypothetical protein
MASGSVAASADFGVYVDWGFVMERMTHASVGVDPWTVVQNKLHPAVAETEFTPLDLSYVRRPDRSTPGRDASRRLAPLDAPLKVLHDLNNPPFVADPEFAPFDIDALRSESARKDLPSASNPRRNV